VENSGNSVQPRRKIVKVVLVRRSDICVKQLLIGYTGSYMVRVWW